MGPKKSVKMDLGSFLADDSLGGSWADEEVDMSSIGVPVNQSNPVRREESSGFSAMRSEEPRRERKEFPIPDAPPYRVRVGNLPWDITDAILIRFFENRMQLQDIITEVKLPADINTGRLKGFGFVTFVERTHLEEALNLNLADLSGRKVFVNVAAPQKQDVFEMDWRAARTGPLESKRREESELDWGSARNTSGSFSQRERSERRPRREEPDLDWGSARNTSAALPPRERSNRKPRKDGPELDWGSARSTTSTLPPREKSNRRPRKEEPEFDWKRGQAVEPKKREQRSKKPESQKPESIKPQKSSFDVLAVSDSDSEDTNNTEKEVKKSTGTEEETDKLTKITSELTLEKDDGWEVVGK